MSHPTADRLLELQRLLLKELVRIRTTSLSTHADSNHAHGILAAALALGHIDIRQHTRLGLLIYSASSNRNRELSLRLLPYGRRFPARRAAA